MIMNIIIIINITILYPCDNGRDLNPWRSSSKSSKSSSSRYIISIRIMVKIMIMIMIIISSTNQHCHHQHKKIAIIIIIIINQSVIKHYHDHNQIGGPRVVQTKIIIKIIIINESKIIIVIIRFGYHEFYGPELSSKSLLSMNQKSSSS